MNIKELLNSADINNVTLGLDLLGIKSEYMNYLNWLVIYDFNHVKILKKYLTISNSEYIKNTQVYNLRIRINPKDNNVLHIKLENKYNI